MSDVLSRCPYCTALTFDRIGGECQECGWTGTCPYCDYRVEPDGPFPQYHDGPCAAEAAAEALADRKE